MLRLNAFEYLLQRIGNFVGYVQQSCLLRAAETEAVRAEAADAATENLKATETRSIRDMCV